VGCAGFPKSPVHAEGNLIAVAEDRIGHHAGIEQVLPDGKTAGAGAVAGKVDEVLRVDAVVVECPGRRRVGPAGLDIHRPAGVVQDHELACNLR
jgi:hypothetical protein